MNGVVKSGELRETFNMAILSQATNALVEGAETTGGIGRLNNQTQRPTQYIGDDIVQPSSKDETS